MKSISLSVLPLLMSAGLLVGCVEFGKVEQGRVIAYDKEKRVCTLIPDQGKTAKDVDYSVLPPVVFALPDDASEVGAEPVAGLLMKVDTSSHSLVLFDEASQGFRTISYVPVSVQKDVSSKDPLVFDRAEKKARKFPVIDQAKQTLTLYLKAEKTLLTMTLPEDARALPERAFEQGDEVRVYYKQPNKAQRFMNVSRTDIYQK